MIINHPLVYQTLVRVRFFRVSISPLFQMIHFMSHNDITRCLCNLIRGPCWISLVFSW